MYLCRELLDTGWDKHCNVTRTGIILYYKLERDQLDMLKHSLSTGWAYLSLVLITTSFLLTSVLLS